MKPTFDANNETRRSRTEARKFPKTDYSYHSATLTGFEGGCARLTRPSFHSLSHDYFKGEARRDFLTEALVFSTILATVALPIVGAAQAVLALLHTSGLV